MKNKLLLSFLLVGSITMAMYGCGGDTAGLSTTAAPASGSIAASGNHVILTANKAGTIFYTTSGTVGAAVSGASPLTITAAQLGAPTTLTWHAVDAAGNIESPAKTASFLP